MCRFKKEGAANVGMIAIAGAKGGCGKTTATLGLAEAFARDGTPTIAVDADRQLPDLHVACDLDREPTIAAVADGNVADVAQRSPRAGSAGVLPAPRSSEDVDLQSMLRTLEGSSYRILVDCPSGAGPDVVEPVAAADEVLVVTDATNRSLSAAQTSIDIARRLDVPVTGVLLNCSETVPGSVDSKLDVGVVGTVPKREPPLEDDAVQRAYDDVVTRLKPTDPSDSEPSGEDAVDRLSTGVAALDDALDGGLVPGTVVAVRADTDCQSELLLYELTTTRGTLYLSTQRSESVVQEAIEHTVADVGKPTVRRLDGPDPLAEAERLVRQLPDGANLVVDTAGPLERLDPQQYTGFLNTLSDVTQSTNGIAMLHCLRGPSVPDNRGSTEYFADVVLDVETDIDERGVNHRMTVPKSRRERTTDDAVVVDFSTETLIGERSDGA